MRIVLLALVVLASACGKSSECPGAVAKMKRIIGGEMPDEQADQLEKALVSRCTTDKWSSEAIDCVKSAGSVDDLDKCQPKFTKEQGAALEKAVDRLLNGGTARTPEQIEKARKQDELDRQYDEAHKNDPKPPKVEEKPAPPEAAKPEEKPEKPEGEGDKPTESGDKKE